MIPANNHPELTAWLTSKNILEVWPWANLYPVNSTYDFTAVENEVAVNRFQRSERNDLIYNDPLAYADLILNSKLNVLFE